MVKVIRYVHKGCQYDHFFSKGQKNASNWESNYSGASRQRQCPLSFPNFVSILDEPVIGNGKQGKRYDQKDNYRYDYLVQNVKRDRPPGAPQLAKHPFWSDDSA
jgi:hypothetical protein